MGPLGSAGALWLGQPRPGLALGWTLGAPKCVLNNPPSLFALLEHATASTEVVSRTGLGAHLPHAPGARMTVVK